MSIGLVYEIDDWIYHFKFFRVLSLLTGYGYTFLWITFFLRLLDIVGNWEGDYVGLEVGPADMFSAMVLSYNLILTAPILPINFVIALKELSMEWFQFMNKTFGYRSSDVALGFYNLIDLIKAMF